MCGPRSLIFSVFFLGFFVQSCADWRLGGWKVESAEPIYAQRIQSGNVSICQTDLISNFFFFFQQIDDWGGVCDAQH